MTNKFAGSEIVELGIQIEINGKNFYEAVSKKSKNPETKKIFNYLAGEEEKHVVKFRKILDSVHKYEPKEAYTQEYFAYMNSLASDYVFTKKNKGEEIARSVKDEKEAIKFGVGFEKESITFYEGMKKIVPKADQDIINELILQEKNHLEMLKRIL